MSKQRRYFITGIDTEVGKTFVSCALLQSANQNGLTTAAVKPLASGCYHTEAGLRNEDAVLLQQTMSLSLRYDDVNPIAFSPAIAPHIAADQARVALSVQQLSTACEQVFSHHADITLVEGVGGWRVPLNDKETMADVVKQLKIPVIMVVAIRLGCLNHSLLSYEAIKADGLTVAGWIANVIDEQQTNIEENIAYLQEALPAPLLGTIPALPVSSAGDQGEVIEAASRCLPRWWRAQA